MKVSNILSIVAVLLGEAIIIGAFFLWRGNDTPDNIFIMNMVVSSIVYLLCFYDVLIPLINTKDSSHRQVGSLGLRWSVTGIYVVLSVIVMLLFNKVFNVVFIVQLLVHCILLFLLILGVAGVMHSSGKVASVHKVQEFQRHGLDDMKKAVSDFEDVLHECQGAPAEIFDKIMQIKESIRYLSPSNNPEAYDLEHRFVSLMHDASDKLVDYDRNRVEIEKYVSKAERILNSRKDIYSN